VDGTARPTAAELEARRTAQVAALGPDDGTLVLRSHPIEPHTPPPAGPAASDPATVARLVARPFPLAVPLLVIGTVLLAVGIGRSNGLLAVLGASAFPPAAVVAAVQALDRRHRRTDLLPVLAAAPYRLVEVVRSNNHVLVLGSGTEADATGHDGVDTIWTSVDARTGVPEDRRRWRYLAQHGDRAVLADLHRHRLVRLAAHPLGAAAFERNDLAEGLRRVRFAPADRSGLPNGVLLGPSTDPEDQVARVPVPTEADVRRGAQAFFSARDVEPRPVLGDRIVERPIGLDPRAWRANLRVAAATIVALGLLAAFPGGDLGLAVVGVPVGLVVLGVSYLGFRRRTAA
jgi:hypothetical protein